MDHCLSQAGHYARDHGPCTCRAFWPCQSPSPRPPLGRSPHARGRGARRAMAARAAVLAPSVLHQGQNGWQKRVYRQKLALGPSPLGSGVSGRRRGRSRFTFLRCMTRLGVAWIVNPHQLSTASSAQQTPQGAVGTAQPGNWPDLGGYQSSSTDTRDKPVLELCSQPRCPACQYPVCSR